MRQSNHTLVLPTTLWQPHSIDLTRHQYAGRWLGLSEGLALGKAQRQQVKRRSLGQLAERPSGMDALQVYAWSNQGRLVDLLPVRARRMSVSPFTFFRGMPALMLYDMAWESHSGLFQQICGDCHLLNFGGFASPERHLLFGINDFDETIVAPFEWDLKRLATSFVIAAREIGADDQVGLAAIEVMFDAYRQHLLAMTKLSPLQVWYEQITAEDLLAHTDDAAVREQRRQHLAKAPKRTSASVLPKLTERDPITEQRQFIEEAPLLRHPQAQEVFSTQVQAFFQRYRSTLKSDRQVLFDRYRCTDVALKVVGVGSVGTRCAVALFEDADREPLILQMKEASTSILAPLLPQRVAHDGQRVVQGQQLLQAASDIFLGYASHTRQQIPFYVRQLRDMKLSADLTEMDVGYLLAYATSCGYALAHAQGKAGNPDVLMGYLGQGQGILKTLQRYALDYAARNAADYAVFMAAVEAGQIVLADDSIL
ncbi:MAG: DUF2252 domain-containing protein [Pseudomonadota bacterium]|nr:DUF2252 domain-containing protein [Pseudomonadota bacterium]